MVGAGGSTLYVFLDLAKAFNSVPQARVMSQLYQAGVRDPLLAWFHSYLMGRSKFVAVEGASSTWAARHLEFPRGP